MPTRKDKAFRILRVKKTDDLKTIYAKAHRSITASELQKYTQEEEMFPAEELLAELEAVNRKETGKRKPKKAT